MNRKTIWLLTVIALGVWGLAGCSDTPSTPSADEDLLVRDQTVDLDDPYGGFNLGDEDAAFGDAMLTTDYGPDATVAFDDPMADDAEVKRIRERHRLHRYLMITWGNLDADSSIDFVTDWSGGLTVDNGVVLLARTVRFEPNDRILPRTSRDAIDWVSYTKPHFDGIIVALHKALRCDSTHIASTCLDVPVDEPLSVTFRTGPLTVTIDEADLADLHRVVTVDEAGNAVAFNTITVMPEDCPSGFMAGQWRDVNDRPGGIFRGKWISRNGAHMGYLRGVYGPNSRGEKVFFGKWITAGGRFEGLLRGHYEPAGDRPGGTFQGEWISRQLRVMGGLKGVYGKRDTDNGRHMGWFRARWRARCR
jgi:hypothetical protein